MDRGSRPGVRAWACRSRKARPCRAPLVLGPSAQGAIPAPPPSLKVARCDSEVRALACPPLRPSSAKLQLAGLRELGLLSTEYRMLMMSPWEQWLLPALSSHSVRPQAR